MPEETVATDDVQTSETAQDIAEAAAPGHSVTAGGAIAAASSCPAVDTNADSFDILFLYAEEPVHAGVGQGLGAIDQPIQREVHTNFPVVYGSGIRGALRESIKTHPRVRDFFGSAPDDPGDTRPGAISPHDARIVLFPVQSFFGGFAWTTCPLALSVLWRNLGLSGASPCSLSADANERWEPIMRVQPGRCLVAAGDSSRVATDVDGELQSVFRDHTFDATPDSNVTALGQWLATHAIPTGGGYDTFWSTRMVSNLAVLSDEDFQFLSETGTEVFTRVRMKTDMKVVDGGALWSEEAIPPESLLQAFVAAKNTEASCGAQILAEAVAAINAATRRRITIGGTESIGRGRMYLTWLKGGVD